jgi:hypothetical protein
MCYKIYRTNVSDIFNLAISSLPHNHHRAKTSRVSIRQIIRCFVTGTWGGESVSYTTALHPSLVCLLRKGAANLKVMIASWSSSYAMTVDEGDTMLVYLPQMKTAL